MKPPVILRIFKGAELIEVKQFNQDQIIIGNGGETHVRLVDDSVSTIHCLIELRENGYFVADLGSAKGTFRNEKQVLDEALSSGDQLKIGIYSLQFFVGVPKPKAPPQAGVEEMPPTPAKPKATVAAPTPAAKPVTPPNPPIPPAKPAPQKPAPQKPTPAAPPPAASTAAPKAATAKPQLPDVAAQGPVFNPKPTIPKSMPSGKKTARSKNFDTFAPGSAISDLRDYLKPTKGPTLEVITCWNERVLTIQHYSNSRNLRIGTDDLCDVRIPPGFAAGNASFIEFNGGTRIQLQSSWEPSIISAQANTSLLSSEDLLRSGQLARTPNTSVLRLEQNEVAALQVGNGSLQIFVRHVPLVASPTLAGLDLTASELTSLIVSLIAVALFGLFMSVYTPPAPIEEKTDDALRLAKFIYNKTETPKPPEPEKQPLTEVKVEDHPKPTKIEVAEPKQSSGNPSKASAEKQQAKAAEIRPKDNVNKPKKFTSVKQGGSVKTGDTEGSTAKAKDVTKMGLMATLNSGGVRTKIDQTQSGSGDLAGMADKATGKSGSNRDRSGTDIGSQFKDTGAGGKGTQTQGIAGVGTVGRSSGQSEYGKLGVGGKGTTNIELGGSGAEFTGTVDREAVRRVIRNIYNQIKSCYDRSLRSHSDLEGKIVVHWEVSEQGRVTVARPKEASKDMRSVAECVAGRIADQRFPEPPAGTMYEVDYPFLMGRQQ